MFFVVSKIFWFVFSPVNFLLICLGAAWLLRLLGRVAVSGVLLRLSLAVLLISGLTPVGNLMLAPLENRFPQLDILDPPPKGIIVLGGAINEGITAERGSIALTDMAARMTEAVAMARRYPNAKLIFTGGAARFRPDENTEAWAARHLWLDLGIEPERMIFEDRSRNTFENALYTKNILNPVEGDRYVLITSAFHMPRSVGIFNKVGFKVIPYPVDYHTRPWPYPMIAEISAVANMQMVEIGLREWIGIFAYYLTGRSAALFPGPDLSIPAVENRMATGCERCLQSDQGNPKR